MNAAVLHKTATKSGNTFHPPVAVIRWLFSSWTCKGLFHLGLYERVHQLIL